MSFQHADPARNDAADAVVDRVDVGGANGTLEFLNNAAQVLCVLPLNSPAFGNAGQTVQGRADLVTAPSVEGTVSQDGQIDRFIVKNAGGTAEWTGDPGSVTATAGGGDIELSDVDVTVGSTITMTNLFYTFVAQGN